MKQILKLLKPLHNKIKENILNGIMTKEESDKIKKSAEMISFWSKNGNFNVELYQKIQKINKEL